MFYHRMSYYMTYCLVRANFLFYFTNPAYNRVCNVIVTLTACGIPLILFPGPTAVQRGRVVAVKQTHPGEGIDPHKEHPL